jgi:hypothetical protein
MNYLLKLSGKIWNMAALRIDHALGFHRLSDPGRHVSWAWSIPHAAVEDLLRIIASKVKDTNYCHCGRPCTIDDTREMLQSFQCFHSFFIFERNT